MLSKVKQHKLYPLILIAAFGIINWIAWPVNNFVYLIFVGFVPILLLEEHFNNSTSKRKNLHFFLSVYSAFLFWNTLTTWWVCLASVGGGVAAIILNSLLMSIPVMLFWFTKNVTKVDKLGYASFIIYWISFEYLHLNWDGSWPWLTLGNVFGNDIYLVQWYEYTGVLGGTFWILMINVIVYLIVTDKGLLFENAVYLLAFLVIPVLLSIKFGNVEDKGKEVEMVVVQPNIDPYNEKFPGTKNFIKYDIQLERLISLSEKKITQSTDFLIWPETSIPSGIVENEIYDDQLIKILIAFRQKYPNLTLVAGADTYRIHGKKKENETSRFAESIGYYDNYNTAIKFGNDSLEVYHKSKLVPGVEIMPMAKLLAFLEPLAINMGGTFGSLGRQKEPSVFKNEKNIGVAPVICYESIYGDYISKYVTKGANIVCIITNDGWWGETSGYKQHLAFAKLRAIEFRRSVARAANTGVSCFINQKGEMSEKTNYWEQDVRKATLKANTDLTFYAQYGDITGRVASPLAFALLVSVFVKLFTSYKKKK